MRTLAGSGPQCEASHLIVARSTTKVTRSVPSHLLFFHSCIPGALSHSHHRIGVGTEAMGLSLVTFFGRRKTRSVLASTGQSPHCSFFSQEHNFHTRCRAEVQRHFGMNAICSNSCACLVAACRSLQFLHFHGRTRFLQVARGTVVFRGLSSITGSDVSTDQCTFHSCISSKAARNQRHLP